MAGELQIRHTTSSTGVYDLIFSAVGTVWNGTALETYAAGNYATYDVALTELGASQIFTGTFPAGLAAGIYHVFTFDGTPGSPAEADTYVTDYWVEWSGSVLLPRAAWASVDADPVSKARTWKARHDAVTCRQIVEVTTQDTATYAMDFSEMLNPGTSLLTADSVTDTSGNALTTSSVVLSQDKRAVHFTVTASDLAADTQYSMRATTTTTDGTIFARIGTLKSL